MNWMLEDGFTELLPAEETAVKLIDALKAASQKIATVESCTGGMIASALVSVSGASEVFENGFITYSNEAKMRLVQVSEETLRLHTEVSAETAAEMAQGCAAAGQADLTVSVTGIAGPGGGSAERPVGLVYIGCYYRDRVRVQKYHFHGDREAVRTQATAAALQLAYFCLRVR